jgi:hypothetical protein
VPTTAFSPSSLLYHFVNRSNALSSASSRRATSNSMSGSSTLIGVALPSSASASMPVAARLCIVSSHGAS